MTTLAITGGQVLRPDSRIDRVDVLIDREAGTILAVDEDVDADETLDATDGLVIPGLVNAHCHAAMTLLRGYADDKPLGAWLQEDIWPVEAALTADDVRVGTELAAVELIRSGTTAFADMYFHEPTVAEVVEASGLRAVLGHGVVTVGKDDDEAHADADESVAFAAEYDGAADGRISTAVMPHSLTTVRDDILAELAERARTEGVSLHLHANETADEVEPIVAEHGVRPLAHADDLGVLDGDVFLAHCVHVDDEEIELLAEHDVGVVHCPASNMKLASGMAPVQRMLDAGVTVGIGTDGAASNNDLDPFDELRDAAMLGKLAANDASAVAAADAFRMATEGSARTLGLDTGRIEPGAKADVAVLDLDRPHLTPAHDLVSHLVYAARGSDVRHTVCDGRVLMRDRTVLTLDEQQVRERAQRRANDLIDRATG